MVARCGWERNVDIVGAGSAASARARSGTTKAGANRRWRALTGAWRVRAARAPKARLLPRMLPGRRPAENVRTRGTGLRTARGVPSEGVGSSRAGSTGGPGRWVGVVVPPRRAGRPAAGVEGQAGRHLPGHVGAAGAGGCRHRQALPVDGEVEMAQLGEGHRQGLEDAGMLLVVGEPRDELPSPRAVPDLVVGRGGEDAGEGRREHRLLGKHPHRLLQPITRLAVAAQPDERQRLPEARAGVRGAQRDDAPVVGQCLLEPVRATERIAQPQMRRHEGRVLRNRGAKARDRLLVATSALQQVAPAVPRLPEPWIEVQRGVVLLERAPARRRCARAPCPGSRASRHSRARPRRPAGSSAPPPASPAAPRRRGPGRGATAGVSISPSSARSSGSGMPTATPVV